MYAENMNVYPNSGGTPSFEPSECFRLHFLEGTRIRMCYGCSNPIRTDTSVVPPPPHIIVIAYKERRWYRDPHTQSMKLTATEENTYYHFTRKCVEMKHPSFTKHMLHIPRDILAKLTVRHKMQLHDEFAMEV